MIGERSAVKNQTTSLPGGTGDEAYRLLRSTLKFAATERPIRSILVVDIDAPAGSEVARRLAEAIAQGGDRCALVDTETRGAGEAPGLADLVGGAPLDAVVSDAGRGTVVVVPAGRGATADMLAHGGVTDALTGLLSRFEFVVLSSAPLPKYADALALAPRVDAVIMVVSAGKTRRAKAIDARDALLRVGANILGVVLAEGKRGTFR